MARLALRQRRLRALATRDVTQQPAQGSGIPLLVADAWAPYLKYGVLADMFSKDGRGQDLLRARYCEQRFAEGIALASVLVDGFA